MEERGELFPERSLKTIAFQIFKSKFFHRMSKCVHLFTKLYIFFLQNFLKAILKKFITNLISKNNFPLDLNINRRKIPKWIFPSPRISIC